MLPQPSPGVDDATADAPTGAPGVAVHFCFFDAASTSFFLVSVSVATVVVRARLPYVSC